MNSTPSKENQSNNLESTNPFLEAIKSVNKKTLKKETSKKITDLTETKSDSTLASDGMPVKDVDEGKNFKRQVETRRNILFQLLTPNEVAIDIDFEPESEVLNIIEENEGKKYRDTKLYSAPMDKYEQIVDQLDNLSTNPVTVYPLPEITIDYLRNLSFTKLKFTCTNEEEEEEENEIDYSKDEVKSFDSLPKHRIQKLFPYQREGVKFALRKFSRLLIADEMGLGKTTQAVTISGFYPEEWPVLILCPGSVKSCWRDQILEWLDYHKIREEDIQVINSSKEGFRSGRKFYILTYDLAKRVEKELLEQNFKFIIADECHLLKNHKSKRFQILMSMIQKAKRLLLLSGTPILAKPCEAFHVVNALRPDIFPNFNIYGERFCDPKITEFGKEYSGVSNTKELHCVISGLSIRRLKKDVLPDLPPKKRQKVEVECDKKIVTKIRKYLQKSRLRAEFELERETKKDEDEKEIEEEKKSKENSFKKSQINQKNKEDSSLKSQSDNSVTQSNITPSVNKRKNNSNNINSNGEDELTFAEAYSLTGEAKLKGIKNYINVLLANKCKFLVFAHHMSVLNSIESYLRNTEKVGYIRIDGKVQNEDRDAAVNTFQNDENCLVALLGITAAGTGVTLTAASTVLFAELYFTPALMIQAEDRTHRFGQKKSVNVHYLYGPNTIDEIMFPRLRDKYFVVSTTLDDQKLELNLEKIEVGITGEFADEQGVINQRKTEFDEFKEEALQEGQMIEDEFENVSPDDLELLGLMNLHDGQFKRTRLEENEDEDDFTLIKNKFSDIKEEQTEETTNISFNEENFIPKKSGKYES